jgi:hypothetical protein
MADYYRAWGNNARRGDWPATTARAIQGKKRERLLPFRQRFGCFRGGVPLEIAPSVSV